MTELPCFSAVLQLAREGASAATFSTQVVTPITAIAISARKTPATIATLAPMLPRRRCRRRPRCVIPESLGTHGVFALSRTGYGELRTRSGVGVRPRVVVDDPFDQQLVGD